MKIELTITREDGRYLKYGEATPAGVPDSEIVLQTLLQHVGATAIKVRTDLARGVAPKWLAPEVPIDVLLEQALREVPVGAEQAADPAGFDPERNRKPVDDEPVTLDDDSRLDELRAGNLDVDPADFEYDDARREDVQAEEGDLVGDPLMPTGDELPATPESGETAADRAVRAPHTRTARGRAVKDSPQA